MNYSLEQLLSGKKVVCRNGLVPNMIVYFPSIYNKYYTEGVLIIQVPFGAQNSLLHIDAYTGKQDVNVKDVCSLIFGIQDRYSVMFEFVDFCQAQLKFQPQL